MYPFCHFPIISFSLTGIRKVPKHAAIMDYEPFLSRIVEYYAFPIPVPKDDLLIGMVQQEFHIRIMKPQHGRFVIDSLIPAGHQCDHLVPGSEGVARLIHDSKGIVFCRFRFILEAESAQVSQTRAHA